jgi:hypothetical protein
MLSSSTRDALAVETGDGFVLAIGDALVLDHAVHSTA